MSDPTRYAISVKPVVGGKWRRIGIRNGQIVWINFAKRRTFTMADRMKLKPSRWAKLRGMRCKAVKVDPYPYLVLDTDTTLGNRTLAAKANELGRRLKREIFAREFKRTRARQEELWAQYEARGFRPPLVARPGTSPHESGNAIDAGVRSRGGSGMGVNVGAVAGAREIMRELGLCLNVPGENWHMQLGNTWKA